VVQKFIEEAASYATPDAPPKLQGRGLTVMLSPLPKNKRAKPPEKAAAPLEEPVPANQETA
jgi:hypothetical protein